MKRIPIIVFAAVSHMMAQSENADSIAARELMSGQTERYDTIDNE